MGVHTCPKCGSTNTSTSLGYKAQKGLAYVGEIAVGYAFERFGLTPIGDVVIDKMNLPDRVSIRYKCSDCGHVWDESSDPVFIQNEINKIDAQKARIHPEIRKRYELLVTIAHCDQNHNSYSESSFIQSDANTLKTALYDNGIIITLSEIASAKTYRELLDRILEPNRQSFSLTPQRRVGTDDLVKVQNSEKEYLEMFREYAARGEISALDRKMLNKMRDMLGISEERAKEIERL